MGTDFALPILLDGATGSNLIERGLPAGVCVEEWILENPDVLIGLQKEFIEAGSNIIYAPTFSANRKKLEHYGLEEKTVEFNKRLVELSKKASAGRALVAGDISPTGDFVEPFGSMTFSEMIDVYKEQAGALKEAGVDLFVIETMMSLSEIRAAVIACRKFSLPIFVTITVDENGRTLTGATALSCLISLQEMGISAFGLNCSHGPDKMAEVIKEIAPFAKIPLIAKPNAGQPDECGRYGLSPEDMAKGMEELLKNGVTIAGGCCGSTPEHIAAIRKLLDGFDFSSVKIEKQDTGLMLANETQVFYLSADGLEASEPVVCGVDMADELLELSDSNLDVITIEVLSADDAYQFSQNSHMAKLPVMFKSDDPMALKSALLTYHGRAMVDGKSSIPEDELRKIAAKYGAILY
ncbi:MAG: 5-methyltetrahydrofolate--homocysteine methyltransferase [Clostridiales bacterium]|jgi:5-methyltetrahydrofolate--homocysteine methyltransferase|nr:hypothetical protein [Oscillospiraceae bacterium]MDN5377803.1 5-methyltetrahydrofolate--homocysteine methyltransferase [Clostridiales bacterium]